MALNIDDKRWRIVIILGVIMMIFLLMLAKAFQEQISLSDEHQQAVSRQSLRRIRIPANRGKIFSADLQVMAENIVSYDVNFYLAEMRQPGGPGKTVKYAYELYKELAKKLNRPELLREEDIRHHVNWKPGLPLAVFTNLSDREITEVFKISADHPGIEVAPNSIRYYPLFDSAAQIIGYAQKQRQELALDRKDFFAQYYQSDLVGIEGLEKYCDAFPDVRGLRGEPGFQVIKVDNYGFVREIVDRSKDTEDGNNVVLTIDSHAQRIAENLMQSLVGAMIVMDAETGEIIAITSQPSYNLNLFSPFITAPRYRALLNDPDKPLFNRALYGSYMPGSIIKPLSALAFLANGIDPEEEMICDGHTIVNGVRINCTARNGHGPVNLYTALEKSCNDYIIEHAVAVGLDELVKQFSAAGIGRDTGFELGGAKGRLPDREYLKKREKRNWSNTDTGYVSIGQGQVEVSPMQAVVYAAALANGGKLMKPFIVKKVVDGNGAVLMENNPEITGRLPAPQKHLDMIKQAMFQVVHAARGTGRRAYSDLLTIYAKTGTAEVGRKPNLRNNSLLICFATYGKRTYAMVIIVENGTGGGRDCAPLAKEFFEKYLQL